MLALIPARGGSRGIPSKNLQRLGNVPLIAHAIRAAQAACVDRVVVSTDSARIARTARRYGAEVPWLRPARLARSASPVIDAVLHALDQLEQDQQYSPATVILLQPTSPFRTAAAIKKGLLMHERARGASVVAVSPATDHPYWCRKLGNDRVLRPFVSNRSVSSNRQDLPPAFRVNGALYIATVRTLRASRSFYSPRTLGLELDAVEGLDIDTPLDLEVARALWRTKVRGTP